MTNEEAARILDPDTSREALRPYALDCVARMAMVEEACRLGAEALRERPEWIPVTERLPEDRSDVLVVAYWHERWNVYMGWCAPERAEWSVHDGIGDRDDVAVTHWMPLPEPPEEGEQALKEAKEDGE